MKRTRAALWVAIAGLAAERFCFLTADFPNGTPWGADQAKFTDEGWWSQAAVMHQLLGHWNIPGDYNPAAALPVWPALLSAVFHFSGDSIVAARALATILSVAAIGITYWLVRRFADKIPWAAEFAALMLAASPFAFVFFRLAILDSLVVFEFCLALLLASFAQEFERSALVGTSFLATGMLLTKTTSAVVLPAVLWISWNAIRTRRFAARKAFCAVIAAPLIMTAGYFLLLMHSEYRSDIQYFFSVNGLSDLSWRASFMAIPRVVANGMWIDRILYPAALVSLALSLVRYRQLWRNPLFAAFWIAMAGECLYLLRRQDDYAPRYLLLALMPVMVIVAITVGTLLRESPRIAILGWTAVAAAVAMNTWCIEGWLRHREYAFYGAAQDMARIVNREPAQPRLLLGICASEESLMTGIPSINDAYGTMPLSAKIQRYRPGWYVAWNGVGPDELEAMKGYRLEQVAQYHAFDDDDRRVLLLYRMAPVH